MTKIRIDTEHTREVGQRLIAEGDRMLEIAQELQNAIGRLDTGSWDGRSRGRAEPMLDRVGPSCARVAEGLDELGRKLARVAETFEERDNTAAQNLEGMPWVDFETSSQVPASYASSFMQGISNGGEGLKRMKDGLEFVGGAWIAAGLKKGSSYAGETIVYGTHSLKELGGVSPYLTHIKSTNIPRHMAGQTFVGEFSKSSILLEGVSEAGENWREYEGDASKVSTGIVVDTLIGLGGASIGATAGTFAVGAIGGVLLGPPGAVVGAKLGAILGGWLGGKAAEWVEDVKLGDRELDQTVVETIDQGLSAFVDNVVELF